MASVSDPRRRTAEAIFARYVRDEEDWRRAHLGASIIGRPCSREIWYRYRWAIRPELDGQILRLFERGKREEAWLLDELEALGLQVERVNPLTGQQWTVSFHGGRFGGSADAKVLGVLEAPSSEHVFEAKTANGKRFREVQRHGVKVGEPEHYLQVQVYMKGLKIKRALYLCVCKDTDEIYQERIAYDRKAADMAVARAHLILESSAPLSKISEDPTWYECRFCDARPVCQLGQVERLERNCRTCASSSQAEGLLWRCELHQAVLDVEAQRAGCPEHLFNPHLLPWPVESVDEPARTVTYRRPDGVLVTDANRELTIGID